MNSKNVKCVKCTRMFVNKHSMLQHCAASHAGASAPVAVAQRRRPVRRTASQAAPVASPMEVVGRQTNMAKMSGVDRFATVSNVSKEPTKSLLIDKLVVPAEFERLKFVARTFQRIVYHRLIFRIEPQISTNVSGGYVVAFVRDPADKPEGYGDGVLEYLTAQQGSRTTKWWQSSVVVAGPFQRQFYTSESVEIREFSPGRLVLAVDGAANQTGNVTVFVDWEVSLSQPALEMDKQVTQAFTVTRNIYLRTGYTSVWTKTKNGTWDSSAVATFLPGAHIGQSFRLPYPLAVQDTTTTVRMAWYLHVKDSGSAVPAWEHPTDDDPSNAIAEILFLPAGATLESTASSVQENYQGSSSVTPTKTENSSANSPEDRLESIEKKLESLSSCLRRLETFLKPDLGCGSEDWSTLSEN